MESDSIESFEDEPASKRTKTDNYGLYPVDFIKTESDLGDGEQELPEVFSDSAILEPNSQCGICGENAKFHQQKKLSNIIYHGNFDHLSTYKILELRCDAIERHVAALYVGGRWWCTEDMLLSSDTSRNGLVDVTTFGDRLVLTVLNTVVFNEHEKMAEEPTFKPHPPNESAKLMWQSGRAVGFYTVKRKGKLVSEISPEVWSINVLDTIFVRKSARRQGIAKKMVEDFMNDFPVEDIGFSFPLGEPLKAICFKILSDKKEERDRIWECREPGGCHGRLNLWLSLKSSM